MKTVNILIGIPTSGKSTWAKKQNLPIISCDEIRKEFGTNYDPKLEKLVWDCFYRRISEMKEDFIIDNTNCKIGYINKIKETIGKDFKIEYIWFSISLWKAFLRNIIRYFKEDKWIPIDVLKNMFKNFNKLKKEWKE